MRRGNGAAVGAEQQLARHGARCSPSPQTLLLSPTAKPAQCPVPYSPRFGSKVGQGASPAHPPPWCWAVMGGRCINPLSHKACLDCSSPVLPVLWRHVDDPCVWTLPTTDRGGRAPHYEDTAAHGRGQACASWVDPLVPDGSGRQGAPVLSMCCTEVELRLWFLLPQGSETPLAPFEALTGVAVDALQVGKSEALGMGCLGEPGSSRASPVPRAVAQDTRGVLQSPSGC